MSGSKMVWSDGSLSYCIITGTRLRIKYWDSWVVLERWSGGEWRHLHQLYFNAYQGGNAQARIRELKDYASYLFEQGRSGAWCLFEGVPHLKTPNATLRLRVESDLLFLDVLTDSGWCDVACSQRGTSTEEVCSTLIQNAALIGQPIH
jgi:hypothetical protein